MSKPWKKRWWASDFFTPALIPVLFSKFRISMAEKEINWILNETGVPKNSKVLDVACGIGRHSIALAKRKYDVDGIDISKSYLNIAKKKSRHLRNKPSFFRKEMSNLSKWHGKVDLCLNLFSSIGYYETRASNVRVINEIVKTLRPGGFVVIDTVFKEGLINSFIPKDWTLFDGGVLLEERKYNSKASRLHCCWTLIKGAQKKQKRFQLYLFSKNELKEILRNAGIPKIRFFGSLSGHSLAKNSFHVVVVGQKK